MTQIIGIDSANKTFTAQAGLQFIEASKPLRAQDLQFMTNIEIGNMTLGSTACCHSKDALDGIEFSQVRSYVTRTKWVTPSGDLAQASESDSPELLRNVRPSYGLCGVVYEVTFRIKPGIFASLLAAARRMLWNFSDAYAVHIIDEFVKDKRLRDAAQNGLHRFRRRALQDNRLSLQYAAWRVSHSAGYQARYCPYTYDVEVFSIDPIHSSTDDVAWHYFLQQF